jgi:hypothetical protein
MLPNFTFKKQLIIFFILIFSAVNAQIAESSCNEKRIIIIDKAEKKLTLLTDGKPTAEFPATFGIDPYSDKYKAFDGATPEGLYFITYKKNKTEFYRFLGISYPNLNDTVRGLVHGVISIQEYKKIYQAIQTSGRIPSDTGLGGSIGIHGGGVFKYFGNNKERDWTEGCIALDNTDIERLFQLCEPGDPVIILNSCRNLFGIIRPFIHIKDTDENGLPICPSAICTYQITLPTFLGQVVIIIKEGNHYGKSLKAMVYADDTQEKPFLVLVDNNADGYISNLDSIKGTIANETSLSAIYDHLRKAVVRSLSMGYLLKPGHPLISKRFS